MERIIKKIDPQPTIRENAEYAPDWEYKDEAVYLYDKAVLLRNRLIDPIARIDKEALPDPVIAFDNLRNYNTLATYLLVRNPVGLQCEITFNTEHYLDTKTEDGKTIKAWEFGKWAQLETLTHEYIHLWQQTEGKDPIVIGKSKNYHNKEFVEKCESIGLHPMPGVGCHTKLASEPFSILMKELGINPPADVAKAPSDIDLDWFKWLIKFWGQDRKGTSTLKKWTCPECGLNVRMGVKDDPLLRHHPCETEAGHPVFLVPGDIYRRKK